MARSRAERFLASPNTGGSERQGRRSSLLECVVSIRGLKNVVITTGLNHVKGVTSSMGGKGQPLVKTKVILQCSKRIGGDFNMKVKISYYEVTAFHGVAVLKVVREFSEENSQEVGSSCWEVDDTDRRAASIAGVGRWTRELAQRKSAGKENWCGGQATTQRVAENEGNAVSTGETGKSLVARRCKVGVFRFIATGVQPEFSYTKNVNIVVQNTVTDCRVLLLLLLSSSSFFSA